MSSRGVKRRLLETVWGTDGGYYDAARAHVLEAAASGREYDWIRAHLPASGRVLEVGCGDGSNLEVLSRPGLEWVGCDLSSLALSRASLRSAQGPGAALAIADVENLPFRDGSFDAVLAISVVEHLPDPERAIERMIAVLAPGGRLLVVSPQYGGPLGASPCRRDGGAGRFFRRIVRAHLGGGSGASLGWDRVEPVVLDGTPYDGDLDTVVEPELQSLERFVERRGMRILSATSGFEWHSWRTGRMSLPQRVVRGIFEPLGRMGIPPYRRFGPLVALCAVNERGA